MPTVLQAQSIKPICDSAISVCPLVFDRLKKNDQLAVQYKAYYITVLAEKNNADKIIILKDSTIADQVMQIKLCDQEKELTTDQLKISQKELSEAEKRVQNRTKGMYGIGLAGIVTTILAFVRN